MVGPMPPPSSASTSIGCAPLDDEIGPTVDAWPRFCPDDTPGTHLQRLRQGQVMPRLVMRPRAPVSVVR